MRRAINTCPSCADARAHGRPYCGRCFQRIMKLSVVESHATPVALPHTPASLTVGQCIVLAFCLGMVLGALLILFGLHSHY